MSESYSDLPEKIAVVVLSSDRYSTLWPLFFNLFFKNWPDCPFRIYLATNEKSFSQPRITSVPSGPDADWSTSIRSSINQVAEDYLLCMMDDMLLTRPVLTRKVLDLLAWAISARVHHLQLKPYNYVGVESTGFTGIVRLKENARFRVSLHGITLWRKDIFLKLLRDGESAWFFEVGGSGRSKSLPLFYATTDEIVGGIVHGIEKGEWLPEGLAVARELGFDPGEFPFGVQHISPLRRSWRRVKRWIGLAMPLPIQLPLQRALFRIYKVFGHVR